MSKGNIVQLITAFIIGVGNFSFGFSTVWPSYTLKVFRSDQSPLSGNFTMAHESLVSSVPMLGCVVGTIFGGVIADAIGRKKGEILSGLILVISASVLSSTSNIILVIIARCVIGIGGGLHSSIFSVFIGEFSSASVRGAVFSIVVFSCTIGVLASYIVGWICSYYVNNYIFLSLNVAFVIFTCCLKETPYYLLRNKREKEALKSLKFYRGTKVTSHEILTEFAEIKSLVLPEKTIIKADAYEDPENEHFNQTDLTITKTPTTSTWRKLISSKTSMRALITVSFLMILVMSSGMVPVQIYAGTLFTKAVPSLSSDLCSIALAVANIVGSVIPVFLSDRVGRRVLMLASTALVGICLVILGVLVRWPLAPDWVTAAMILVYCICFQLGAASVPFMLNSECYLPEVSTLCIVISLSITWIASFVNLALFGPLINLLGLHGTFFLYACISAATVVVVYLILPETSGLNIEAIQKKFAKGFLQVGR